jgi:cyclopropane fatty-acyl-phospholipid synthase-like methyltransferase
METPYTEDYYLRGAELGISNYSAYSWKPDQTLPMIDYLKRYLVIRDGQSILSFGCARGFCVKAFRMRGVEAYGYDISDWAISNCDPSVRDFVSNHLELHPNKYDYVYSKDVLEHLNHEEILSLVPPLIRAARKRCLFIVPLTKEVDGPYINPLDEKDITHQIRWPLDKWLATLSSVTHEFVVSGSFHIPKLKASSEHYPQSAGFLTLQML